MLDDVLDRFEEKSPVAVMARATLENALSSEAVDDLFRSHAEWQYERELLFSSAVDLMSLVVCKVRKSVHAAYQATPEKIGVSITAVYEKLKRIEPSVCEALVRYGARRLTEVIDATNGALPDLLPGYLVKILDGNCLGASEHRIGELREIAAGPLPGKSLVVLDPSRMLMTDIVCCEDGHAQERSLLDRVLEGVAAKDCWVADRNFCVAWFLAEISRRNAFYVIRWHKQMSLHETGPWRPVGPTETGDVFEKPVEVHLSDGRKVAMRLLRIHLQTPTRDGETELRIVANLPQTVSGIMIANLYRERWTLETAFQQLTCDLRCEIDTLGYPAAALFGFCVAVCCYNAFSTMRSAMRAAHGIEKVEEEISTYYLADEIAGVARGLEILVEDGYWKRFATMSASELAAYLIGLAQQMKLSAYKRHPRGPKKPRPKRKQKKGENHVSTQRILDQRLASNS